MGVFGTMRVDDFECYTVEREWKDNTPFVSCIPIGAYMVRRSTYHKGGYAAYEILDVPSRSRILIHKGNTQADLLGCIAPGTGLGYIESRPGAGPMWAVVRSTQAYNEFMAAMDHVSHARIFIRNTKELSIATSADDQAGGALHT